MISQFVLTTRAGEDKYYLQQNKSVLEIKMKIRVRQAFLQIEGDE